MHETGITSRAQAKTHTTSRQNPAPNTTNPSTQSNRRPGGTKTSRQAARDTVTGFLQTDTTFRPQAQTAISSRQNPAPNIINPSTHSNGRPVGTKPSRRAARDIVTGFLQTHTTSRPNPAPNTSGLPAHHPQKPIPHTQHSRPGGTPVHETGITSRAQPETHTTSRPNPAHNTTNPPSKPPSARALLSRLMRETLHTRQSGYKTAINILNRLQNQTSTRPPTNAIPACSSLSIHGQGGRVAEAFNHEAAGPVAQVSNNPQPTIAPFTNPIPSPASSSPSMDGEGGRVGEVFNNTAASPVAQVCKTEHSGETPGNTIRRHPTHAIPPSRRDTRARGRDNIPADPCARKETRRHNPTAKKRYRPRHHPRPFDAEGRLRERKSGESIPQIGGTRAGALMRGRSTARDPLPKKTSGPAHRAARNTPKGIRTPVLALRGLRPRPLDDGGVALPTPRARNGPGPDQLPEGTTFTLRPTNSTTPSAKANRVSSLPMPTFRPGWNFVPRWRTMMYPVSTDSPP